MRRTVLCLFMACAFFCGQAQQRIELPVTVHDGYGPFGWEARAIVFADQDNSDLAKAMPAILGAPSDWTELRPAFIQTDIFQFTYQSYLQDKISESGYERWQKAWTWPDLATLSKTPARVLIALAVGQDASGRRMAVVDTNGDLNLSDEMPFEVPQDSRPSPGELQKSYPRVAFERVSNGRIIPDTAPLRINYSARLQCYFASFPRHATAELDGVRITIAPESFGLPAWGKARLATSDSPDPRSGTLDRDELIEQGYLLTVRGHLYRNLAFDQDRGVLVLEEETHSPDEIYSTQPGFRAPLFGGQEFTTGEHIALEQYRGKYVYLDFWALGCGPCIAEMPRLRQLYDLLDHRKIEFIGIVFPGNRQAISKVMNEKGVIWPHLMPPKPSDDPLVSYNITSFPVTMLIDPDGKVVAKGLFSNLIAIKCGEFGLYDSEKVEKAMTSSDTMPVWLNAGANVQTRD